MSWRSALLIQTIMTKFTWRAMNISRANDLAQQLHVNSHFPLRWQPELKLLVQSEPHSQYTDNGQSQSLEHQSTNSYPWTVNESECARVTQDWVIAAWMRNCLAARRHTNTPGASSLTLARSKMHTGQQPPLINMNFTRFQHSKSDKYNIRPCLKSVIPDDLNVMSPLAC